MLHSSDLAPRPRQAERCLTPSSAQCGAMSANEPAAKERLPAAALAQPGVYGPGRADSWAGRAPLVKGNKPVQQGNRPFPAGRRDLISDHTGGQGRTPCSLGWGRRSEPGKVHHLPQGQMGPHSVWRDRQRAGACFTKRTDSREVLPGLASPCLAPPAVPTSTCVLEPRLCPHQECPSPVGQMSPLSWAELGPGHPIARPESEVLQGWRKEQPAPECPAGGSAPRVPS